MEVSAYSVAGCPAQVPPSLFYLNTRSIGKCQNLASQKYITDTAAAALALLLYLQGWCMAVSIIREGKLILSFSFFSLAISSHALSALRLMRHRDV